MSRTLFQILVLVAVVCVAVGNGNGNSNMKKCTSAELTGQENQRAAVCSSGATFRKAFNISAGRSAMDSVCSGPCRESFNTCSQDASTAEAVCGDRDCGLSVMYYEQLKCTEQASSALCTANPRCRWIPHPSVAGAGLCYGHSDENVLPLMCANRRCVKRFMRSRIGLGGSDESATSADALSRGATLDDADVRMDFWCAKDEHGSFYFPDNCPCEFTDFLKLHTFSKFMIDTFKIGNYRAICELNATKRTAFRRNSLNYAKLKTRLASTSYRQCLRTHASASDCASDGSKLGKATVHVKTASSMLNGMCQRSEGSQGDYCFSLIVAQANSTFTNCFRGLAAGMSSVCSATCDAVLAEGMKDWGCCIGTLQKYFSHIGGGFLVNLRDKCPSLSDMLNSTALGSANACVPVRASTSFKKALRLRIAWEVLKANATLTAELEDGLIQDLVPFLAVAPEELHNVSLVEDPTVTVKVGNTESHGVKLLFTIQTESDATTADASDLFDTQLETSFRATAASLALESCTSCTAEGDQLEPEDVVVGSGAASASFFSLLTLAFAVLLAVMIN